MKPSRISLLATILLAAAADASAQPAEPTEAPQAEPAAVEQPDAWSDRVTISGLVDAYVSVPIGSELRGGTPLRVFDATTGTFTLAYAELTASVAAEPAGFRLDLGFGPVADLTSLEATTSGTPPVTVVGPSEVFKHVQQAYASFKLPGRTAIVVDAGKFVTPAGSELIEAKDNWLYSRSILFGWAIPFTHTGVRATAVVTEQLSVAAMVVNGWDVVVDNNDDKTFGASVLYADPLLGLSGAVNVIGGVEASDARLLVDLVVTKTIGDKLSLNFNGDYGKEGDATWFGGALMGRLALSPHLNVALRVEHFRDPDGVRTTIDDAAITDITAGVGVPVGRGAELRLEGRADFASSAVFDAGDSKRQITAQAAALAWF